jgi:hypothetical protein
MKEGKNECSSNESGGEAAGSRQKEEERKKSESPVDVSQMIKGNQRNE